jgi:hypothetical protein
MDEVLCPGVSTRATRRRIFNSTAFFTTSAALTVTLGLIVSPDGPARAQTVGPGFQPAPKTISSTGTNQPSVTPNTRISPLRMAKYRPDFELARKLEKKTHTCLDRFYIRRTLGLRTTSP